MKQIGWTLVLMEDNKVKTTIVKLCDPVTECTQEELEHVVAKFMPEYPTTTKLIAERLIEVGSVANLNDSQWMLMLCKHMAE